MAEHPGLPGSEIVRRIEEALAIDGTHNWQDMREMLIDGRCQIFWSDHGAWITEILAGPRKKFLNVWVVAGELPEVMEIQKQVERHARENGCKVMVVRGARLGWKNIAKAYGWDTRAVVLSRGVNDG